MMRSRGESEPYRGYFSKILKAHGANAPGGAVAYVVNGEMSGGGGNRRRFGMWLFAHRIYEAPP
jgi:hypothetical protein